MMTLFITFLLKNPIARKASIAALLVLSLWYINRLSINSAFEEGKEAGARMAWTEAEKTNQERWATEQARIKTKENELIKQQEILDQQRADLEFKRTQQALNRGTSKAAFEKALADRPATVAAMPDAVITATAEKLSDTEVVLALETVNILNKRILQLDTQILDYELLYQLDAALDAKELAAEQAKTALVAASLSQMTQERDFYKDAFENVGKKKGRGFWHKVKRIVTLGIAR